ncbi:MAG: ROK family protein [bacterium]|nr:ROK family protein [bacterium]
MYILFDIGGTNMRIAFSRDGATFGMPKIVPTPKDFDEGMKVFKEQALLLAEGETITALGGGIAGALSRDRSIFLNGPHLQGWNAKPIKKTLEELFSAPAFVENDTAIVGLGEAVAGAGAGHAIVVYMTVSTGVGGTRIVNGKIDVSAIGFEPGHQIFDAGGALHETTVAGRGIDLEGYISGTAVTERYGKKPREITDLAFWDEMARLLAYGLNNTIVHWSPDIVVIGGSMMNTIGIPIDRVRANLKGILHIYPELPLIEHSALGDVGGLHGALHFVKQQLSRSD